MLILDKPLVIFDLETTGTDTQNDKIVQIGMVILHPDGLRQEWQTLINPLIPIPPSATEIHGIKDEDIITAPTFQSCAATIDVCFKGKNLGGYNILNFDLPLLEAEFKRVNYPWTRGDRLIVDPLRLFRNQVPHTLTGAVSHYLGTPFDEAHDALEDSKATLDILIAQLNYREGLPGDLESLAAECVPKDYATICGRLRLNSEGKVTIGFGKHNGTPLKELARTNSSYIQWIMDKDFPEDVKSLCHKALQETAGF